MGKLVVEDGLGGLSYDGDGSNEFVIGGNESDTLRGGQGDDYLYGLDGSDDLDGGAGNDFLAGGLGNDNYRFWSGDTTEITLDRIADSDGAGYIWFDGSVIAAGQRTSEVAWLDSTGKLKLTFLDSGHGRGTLVIDVIATHGSIRIQDWAQGDLSLSLGGHVPVVDGSQLTGEDDLFGSNGNNAGGDTIKALGGNDGLEGGAGNDHLDGGDGNDLILGGTGNDVLIGGEGNDYVYDGYEQADFRKLDTTPDPDTGKSEQDQFDERLNTLGATILDHGKAWYIADSIYAPRWTYSDPNATPSGDDTIDAGGGNDTVVAGDGNDIIRGGSGSDRLIGGYDDDVIFGEADDDTISGDYPDAVGAENFIGWRSSAQANHNGNDAIDGGAGNDSISGNGGNDVLSGGSDNDRIWGRGMAGAANSDDADSDYIDGGAGDDMLMGDDGNDVIIGGTGSDNIWGDNSLAGTRHGNDSIDAGAGNDFVSGGGGDDMIEGGAGSDTLTGDDRDIDGSAHGRDLIHGGADNDIIDGGGGDDALYGDDGDDQIFGDMASNETLAATYHGNDYLDGGAGNDLLIGNGGNDQLSGGTGGDELQGGAGDDLLDGGTGKDVLHGEAGDDTLSGDSDDDKLYGGAGDDRLSGGAGVDTLAGGDGKDVLDGGEDNDSLDGEAGNDTIYGGAGDDTIDADDGDDTVYAGIGNDSIYAGAGNDLIRAEDGNDIVTAAEGDDEVYGSAGSDTLHGSAGNDTLYGEDGDDYLTGGTGNDTLVGGAGLNRYYVDRQFGQDVVQLAASSRDQIHLREGITSDELQFSREADDLLVSVADGSTLRLASYFSAGIEAVIVFFDGTNVSGQLTKQQLLDGAYFASATVGTEAADNLRGTVDSDRLYGRGGNDTLTGLAGDDLLDGGTGEDTLYGDGGNDVLFGGAGNDTYYISADGGHDKILGLDASDAGSDRISIDTTILPGSIRILISGDDVMLSFDASSEPADILDSVHLTGFMRGNHSIQLSSGEVWTKANFLSQTLPLVTGTAGDDVMIGSDANDAFNGVAGNDVLRGEGGNDWLVGGAGTDLVYGGAGNDTLGGDVYDTLYGGLGDDIYDLDNKSLIVEYAGEGYDQAYGIGSFTLPDNVEKVTASGSGARTVVGNASDNLIVFNTSGSYVDEGSIDGRQGADRYEYNSGRFVRYLTIYADDDDDSWSAMGSSAQFDLVFSAERDLVFDSSLRSVVLGGMTNASVIGDARGQKIDGAVSSGANRLEGLGGNDEYRIGVNDMVVESESGGTDVATVIGSASQSYQVAEGSNIEKFIGGGGLGSLLGSGGNDVLAIDGYSATKLFGRGGNDSLTGSAAVDYLDGGAGDDVMMGMAGDDSYFVDSFGDSIIDSGGFDALYVSVDGYASPTGIERVYLDGAAQIAIGNAGTDRLYGNGLDNVLDGKGGYNDQLDGAGGADQYIFQRGYGMASIFDSGSDGAIDSLELGQGILRSDISVYKDVQSWGSNYKIEIAGATGPYPDIITVPTDGSGQSLLEQIRLTDGSTWTIDQLMNLQMPLESTAAPADLSPHEDSLQRISTVADDGARGLMLTETSLTSVSAEMQNLIETLGSFVGQAAAAPTNDANAANLHEHTFGAAHQPWERTHRAGMTVRMLEW